jgi:CRISPR/Cas system-associated exonuclease Cas4 (RecB family)
MFMPTSEEKKRLLRGTIPRARKLGVDDTLRGWSWSSPLLLSPYEVPLGLSEVANAYCPTGRAGYALVLEAVYEFLVDVGVTVYATIEDDRLHIEREFTTLGDELRMEFVEIRDEKQRMVADELDPGPCEGCEAWCSV